MKPVLSLLFLATVLQLASSAAVDPLDPELRKLKAEGAKAIEEIEKWFMAEPVTAELNARRDQRLGLVKSAYKNLIQQNPKQVSPRLGYGDFLFELDDNEAAKEQWDAALELDAKNPAAWNCLARYHIEAGAIRSAFACFQKAVEYGPQSADARQDLANAIVMFRPEARPYFQLKESEEIDLAVKFYREALQLDPRNLSRAVEIAQTLYSIRPFRAKEAIEFWKHALSIARGPIQEQGVLIHLARAEISAGNFDGAARWLDRVNLEQYDPMKITLQNSIAKREGRPYQPLPAAGPFFDLPNARLF